jgi:hypothetical protein
MQQLHRNVEITYTSAAGKNTLYARVTEGQYELLVNHGNNADATMSVYAQLTPGGEVGPRIVRLAWVTAVQLWSPPPGCGIVRTWPEALES